MRHNLERIGLSLLLLALSSNVLYAQNETPMSTDIIVYQVFTTWLGNNWSPGCAGGYMTGPMGTQGYTSTTCSGADCLVGSFLLDVDSSTNLFIYSHGAPDELAVQQCANWNDASTKAGIWQAMGFPCSVGFMNVRLQIKGVGTTFYEVWFLEVAGSLINTWSLSCTANKIVFVEACESATVSNVTAKALYDEFEAGLALGYTGGGIFPLLSRCAQNDAALLFGNMSGKYGSTTRVSGAALAAKWPTGTVLIPPFYPGYSSKFRSSGTMKDKLVLSPAVRGTNVPGRP